MEKNSQQNNVEELAAPKYWLSLEQWKNDPTFQELAEKEFMSSPLADDAEKDGGWARREFLKLMGASLALTSFGCVRRPAQKIVPYVKRPHEVVNGLTNYYASSFVDGSEGFGVVVATREGRPIKVDGNELHPSNKTGMSARAHAHILNLYDPDRLQAPKKNLVNPKTLSRDTISTSWEKADKEIVAQLQKGKAAFLTGSLFSPSARNLVSKFKSGFGVKHYVWSPLNSASEKEGQRLSYGTTELPTIHYDKAKYILSIDADFLGTYSDSTAAQAGFAKGRKPGKDMNKLVVFESMLSLTGSNADYRIKIRPSQQLDVVMGLLHSLVIKGKKSKYASDSNVKSALEGYANVATDLGIDAKLFDQIAADLWENRGEGVAVAGGATTEGKHSVALQVATNFLNTVLGNDGKIVDYKKTLAGESTSGNEMDQLIADINSGKITSLVISGVNPMYSLPASSKFVDAVKKLEMTVYIGDRIDETGGVCGYVLPLSHSMEAWGDAEITKGVYSIQQPTIRPLYDTRSMEENLIAWLKAGKKSVGSDNWHDFLKSYWEKNIYAKNRVGIARASFGDFWVKLLQDGVLDTGVKSSTTARSFKTANLKMAVKKQTPTADFELVLYPTVGLKDGTLANVSWLQEFPDPVTKICWDNYLCVSPKVAHDKKLKEGQVVTLEVGAKKVKAPVHIQPGLHDHVLALALGYGRTAAGDVANGIGVNAYELAGFENGKVLYAGLFANFKVTKEMYPLANVQGHHSMEGRQIVVEATLEDYMKKASAGIHKHKVFSMWDEHKYDGMKWGMAVDLNSCNGCGSCIVACQSENNIPTVGKKYVLQGREMHWMRVDRYYTGTPEDPGVVNMPLMCQHCDNAPCETVCPVLATVHSQDGINDMIYNRCVGTRYCANNCPYKVRRFNWFDYTNLESPLHMALNPEVTVRDRGVMEKCSFCSHRIKEAKNIARVEKRELKDGDVKVACQTSCAAGCITFGDLNNPNSEVAKAMKDERNYTLLEELNNRPAVQYKTKIRNANKIKSHGGKGHGHHGEKHSEGGHA